MHGITRLVDIVAGSRRLLVLTGAGCSTLSGIPDYRDENGEWKHRRPVMYQDFLDRPLVRQRYWARSLIGWRNFADARPNDAHTALARLEHAGRIDLLVTQNVDGLHQRAGSARVIDLHGQLDRVVCLSCNAALSRRGMQSELEQLNPGWLERDAPALPDGDVALEAPFEEFAVPDCSQCGGVLKPDVVFYGEAVPRERVRATQEALQRCDALLVVGSSLMVWSGLRFVRAASARGVPQALVNLGRTRADDLFDVRVNACCGPVLGTVATSLEN